jgi:small subunit ribosomal protein S16
MAVKLRLTRIGKKKQPQYRIVAADARSPRDGRFIEILGHYDPRQDPSVLTVDNDKAVKWLAEGAQPTERVAKLLRSRAPSSSSRPPRREVSDVDTDTVERRPTRIGPHGRCRAHPHRQVDRRRPDAVTVEVDDSGRRTTLNVRVGEGELGRVIGRRGRTAASIRTVTRAAASKDDVEIDIEFLDD